MGSASPAATSRTGQFPGVVQLLPVSHEFLFLFRRDEDLRKTGERRKDAGQSLPLLSARKLDPTSVCLPLSLSFILGPYGACLSQSLKASRNTRPTVRSLGPCGKTVTSSLQLSYGLSPAGPNEC